MLLTPPGLRTDQKELGWGRTPRGAGPTELQEGADFELQLRDEIHVITLERLFNLPEKALLRLMGV